ncbi:hypothetical protein GGI25_006082 [Coemansia spiralis]|uniref:Uncharacterized protein n=2 Tax=Coemansia TaxID=4863 RepID=A0A9W8KVM8_9FUNG|nr:hypothetical protein EDC05_004700 [Coemansia umbellata]KAJ2620349.1 hypothetical protein GGI26_005058 [Coemansia sp. RSA 1358]KAJ2669657.1 hypothetical protein GGI25_006082 [Coemansia spiralis]
MAEGKGFSLFSALNSLFERARSSAEKESQRLFTPETHAVQSRDTKLAASLGRTRNRPKPRRAGRAERPRPESAASARTRLAATVNLLSIAKEEEESVLEIEEASAATLSSSKRKHINDHRTPDTNSPTIEVASASKRKHTEASHPPSNSNTSSPTTAAPLTWSSSKRRHTGLASPKPSSPTTERPSTSSSSKRRHVDDHPSPSTSAPTPSKRKHAELATLRTTQLGPRSASPHVPSAASSATVRPEPERARLEKVERELHRLKKIIASLLPGELGDELQSVYGEMDQPEDVLAKLMRIRAGVAEASTRVPAPPPLPPVAPALPKPVESGQRNVSNPRPSPTVVRRLRADLRPVARPPKPTKPMPHKDPNVMSQLLEEMRHHRLRPVKKPKDMTK